MYSKYDIINEAANKCNMHTSNDEDEDWDIWFIDGAILPSLLTKM